MHETLKAQNTTPLSLLYKKKFTNTILPRVFEAVWEFFFMRSKRSGSFGVKTAVREKPRFLKKGTLK